MLRKVGRLLRPLPLALASSALLAPSAATADSIRGTGSELVVEKAHAVELRLGRGHAELVVRRTVANGGPRHDQAVFFLELPQGAVAMGLRTLGLKEGKPFWFSGELMEAEAAAARYQELTGVGHDPKDRALLSWRSQQELALQIFPVPPNEQKTVEYTLQIPTVYRDGRDHLDLPALGTDALPADVVVRPIDPSDGLFLGGKPAGREAHLRMNEGVDLALTRHDPPRLGGALAMVPFADKRVLVHQRMEAAAKLSEVPRAAGVVVAIDASRSLTDEELTGEIAAARAYLGHFKDARVEVLTFDRDVRAWHGRLVPVKEAIRDLASIPIQRGNGSRVDDALARASALLADLPSRAPRRVVVFTDTRTREGLTLERIRRAIAGTKAVVHVATVGTSSASVQRDDDHAWAKATRATGGLFWNAWASDDEKEMRRAYEELARPLRIDKLRWEVPGVDPESLGFPETLAEGEGVEDLRVTKLRVGWVKAEGELWSTPIKSVLLPDEAEGKRWSALVFGSTIEGELGEAEMMALAKLGGAVSPVTSYLAIGPGVRPSAEGLDDSIGMIGPGGGGSSRSIGLGRGDTIVQGLDLAGYLRDELRKGLAACGGASHKATVALETTRREVVDVGSVRVGASGPLATCLEQAAWDLDLPAAFKGADHSFTLEL